MKVGLIGLNCNQVNRQSGMSSMKGRILATPGYMSTHCHIPR
jgi:hypothetical protein